MARATRFLVGAALIAAGVTLGVPAVRLLAETWNAATPTTAAAVPVTSGTALSSEVATAPPAGGGMAAGQWLLPNESLPPPVVPRADYTPPPAPPRLPSVPAAVAGESPPLDGTYRSTLQVPPPPLLDAQSAPPAAAAWTLPPTAPRSTTWPTAPVTASTYVIRDGDDLPAIAARFYGHPGAAGSLWAANRDLLPNPELLPIGTEIRLPPPWTIQGTLANASGSGAIEPPPTAVAPRSVDGAVAATPWLAGRPSAAPPPPRPHAATVRLAPGETLETLAERFYGDRRAAGRIWDANRDRLRSPDLAVAGMELRLP